MINANFNSYKQYITDSLYQWDINQKLNVSGLNLSVAPEVHFSNCTMDKAIVKQSTNINHIVSVMIPNSLLQMPFAIEAYIGIYEGTTFKVIEKVVIPVKPRPRPADYQIQDSDEEIYSFKRLENMIANLNAEWESTADTKISAYVSSWLSDDSNHMAIKDYVTPQMFGAKGDGVTDDTDAIQQALNSNTYVFIPNGTYLISSPLTVGLENQKVIGESLNTKIIASSTLTSDMLILSGDNSSAYRSNMELKNITIVGNDKCNGLKFYKNADFFVRNTKVTKCLWGIMSEDALLYNCHAVTVINCVNGIRFKNSNELSGANNVKFDMCKINAISNYAIYSENGNSTHGVLFLSCEIEATNTSGTVEAPILLQSISSSGTKPIVTFRNCWLEGNPGTSSIKLVGGTSSNQYLFDNNNVLNTAYSCDYFIVSERCYLLILNQSDPTTYKEKAIKVTDGLLLIMGSTISYSIDNEDKVICLGDNGFVTSNLIFKDSFGIKLKSQGGSDLNKIYAQSNRLKIESNVRDIFLDGATGVEIFNSYVKPLRLGNCYLWAYNNSIYGKYNAVPTAYNDGKILLTID